MPGTRIGTITTRKYALTADHNVWCGQSVIDTTVGSLQITVPQHEDDDAA